MRNLKKVLSLVLCMAMMLSVMVVGAGAATAYSDGDAIENASAVDFCSALGIINGYEDGSFKPEGTITRAEMTKMMAVAMSGKEPPVVDNGKSSFTDVLTSSNSKWANKYIEFCYAAEVVAGIGNNKYNPDGNITATEAAKMLLVILGKDPAKEGYLGTGWDINVNVDAAKAGLFEEIEGIDLSKALIRDDAAQMIWNALNADLGRGKTLLGTKFGASVDEGIMTAIDYNHDTKVYTYFIDRDGEDFANVENDQSYDKDEFKVTTKTDYNELFAQNVEVLVKGGKALVIHANAGGIVVNDIVGEDFLDSIKNTHQNTVEINGVKYKLDNEANDRDDLRNMLCGFNKYYDRGLVEDDAIYEQYSLVGIDQDGGGDIDVFVTYPFVVLKTERVDADEFEVREIAKHDAAMTLIPTEQNQALVKDIMADGRNQSYENNRWSADIQFDDVTVYGEIPEYGYVLVIPAEYTAQDQDVYIPMELKTDKVTKLSSKDETITLGDTTYDSSKLEWIGQFQQLSVGQTYAYLEVNGYLFVVDGDPLEPAISDYAVVTSVGTVREGADKTYETKILCTDGTTQTINVDIAINDWLWYADQDGKIDPVHAINQWKQHALGHGFDYCAACDQTAKPEVGTLYTVHENDDGYYFLLAVTERCQPWDSVFDVYQAWQDGATLNNEFAPKFKSLDVYLNHGISDIYGEDDVDNYFMDMDYMRQCYMTDNGPDEDRNNPVHVTSEKLYIEDDAVIFVYNKNLNKYSVVSGDDLESQDPETVNWAFTGATEKGPYDVDGMCVATVDLGYVMTENDPAETTITAKVAGDAVRTQVEDGKWVVSVDVIKDGGETATLTTEASVIEKNPLFVKLYQLEEDQICEFIVEGNTLVDVKYYDLGIENGTIVDTKDGKLFIQSETGIGAYAIDEDTIVLNAGDVQTLKVGDEVRFIGTAGGTLELIEW